MGWRSAANYTDKAVNRIEKSYADKAAKRERGMATVLEGVSLMDNYMADKRDFNELSGYAKEQGLEWNKDTKSYIGTVNDQVYNINKADMSAIRDKTKFGDKDFSGITMKGDNIKDVWLDKDRTNPYLRELRKTVKLDNDDYIDPLDIQAEDDKNFALNMFEETEEIIDNPPPVATGTLEDAYDWDDDLADSSWKAGGERIDASGIEHNKEKALKNFISDKDMMSQEQVINDKSTGKTYGELLYKEGAGFTGDDTKKTRNAMADFASPNESPIQSRTTNTYGDRESGEYFTDEEQLMYRPNNDRVLKKTTLWDKVKDVVDVSDTNEDRRIEGLLSNYRGKMKANTADQSWQEKMGLWTGYKHGEGFRPTYWKPPFQVPQSEESLWLRQFSDATKTYSNTEVAGIPEWRLDKE